VIIELKLGKGGPIKGEKETHCHAYPEIGRVRAGDEIHYGCECMHGAQKTKIVVGGEQRSYPRKENNELCGRRTTERIGETMGFSTDKCTWMALNKKRNGSRLEGWEGRIKVGNQSTNGFDRGQTELAKAKKEKGWGVNRAD